MTTLDAHIADVFAGTERVLWKGVFWGGTEQSIIGYGDWTFGSGAGAKPKIGSSVVSFKRLSDVDLDALMRVVRIGREQLA